MSNLVDPLQNLINQAAQIKPKTRTIQQYTQRLDPKNTSGTLLLLDISGSMSDWVGEYRKIDLLRQALNRELAQGETAIAFHSTTAILSSLQAIPDPMGGTALHLAILEGSKLRPKHTLVVSDGRPDDEAQALAAAASLSGIINTLFIGSDNDHNAINFMRQLARLGCGKAEVCDLRRPQQQYIFPQLIAKLRLPRAARVLRP